MYKIFLAMVLLCAVHQLKAQTDSSKLIFYDDFTDNRNGWTAPANKHQNNYLENGCYYIKAMGHAYGDGLPIPINTKKDFSIEAKIKITEGNKEHKNYYSMIFWGREGFDAFNFTFANDGFSTAEVCSGKNQSSCRIPPGCHSANVLTPNEFNVYTIKKQGKEYNFYINGTFVFSMPFTPFYGNLLGFGAGRKCTIAIDYLRVEYL